MKINLVVAIAAALLTAAVATPAHAASKLLAFWNFNNSYDDNDRFNANGDGGGDGGFDFMYDNNPSFDDGWLDQTRNRMYPVHDNFETYNGPAGPNDPGALVDETVWQNTAGVPTDAVEDAIFKAYIDVSNLSGDGAFGSSVSDDWGSFSGTTTGEPGTPNAGGSLAPVGSANNGRSFTIVADLTGYQDIDITWADRGTSTGFNSRIVEVSSNGGTTWTQIYSSVGTLGSTFIGQLAEDTTNVLANAANALIRFTVNGATSTNGNNRFDNIVLSGEVASPPTSDVPEPSSLLVFSGLAGLGLVVRKRIAG